MNAAQAVAKVRKLLGKNGQIHDNRKPSSPELREAARTARVEAAAVKTAAEAAMTVGRANVALMRGQHVIAKTPGTFRDTLRGVARDANLCPIYRRALLALERCPGIDGTDQETGETFRALLRAALATTIDDYTGKPNA